MIFGLSAAAPLLYIALTGAGTHPFGLLALPAGLALALALISATAFTDADYWSDVVVANYVGSTPVKTDWTKAMDVVTGFDVQIWVVRALT